MINSWLVLSILEKCKAFPLTGKNMSMKHPNSRVRTFEHSVLGGTSNFGLSSRDISSLLFKAGEKLAEKAWPGEA